MSESKIVVLPDEPKGEIPESELVFTNEELEKLEHYKTLYLKKEGAVMRGLWLAQEKFGFLPPEVIQLVADSLDIPYAHVYGVATFYTQYFKEKVGKYMLDICTCFSCQVVGGYDVLHHACDRLGIHEGETTDDGMFTVRQAECLGACGTGPVVQITNGPYVHNLTKEKMDALLDDLTAGKMPEFVSVSLPQDEDELGGNRRSDVTNVATAETPVEAERVQ